LINEECELDQLLSNDFLLMGATLCGLFGVALFCKIEVSTFCVSAPNKRKSKCVCIGLDRKVKDLVDPASVTFGETATSQAG